MSRSSAARTAARYLHLRPIRRTKLSDCPVCGVSIYADEKTVWKSLEDSAVRVHIGCTTVYSPEATRAQHEGDTS